MTKKQATTKVIAHWERMIEWAGKQDKMGTVNSDVMFDEISETWFDEDCNFCELHIIKIGSCKKCPIILKYKMQCGKVGWEKANDSETWGEWTKNAKKFLIKLKQI